MFVSLAHDMESVHDGFELLDKFPPFLLIADYLQFEFFPCLRAVFVGNSEYLVYYLVDLFPVVRSDLNASLIEDFLKMTKITGHGKLPPSKG